MSLLKTNLPGFAKDTKTGVIVNTDLETKIKMVKATRQQFKEHKNFEMRIADLEARIARLEAPGEWWNSNHIQSTWGTR